MCAVECGMSKSRHIINKKVSMKVFFPQLVSDQRLEGYQIVEKRELLQTIYTQGFAHAISCHFSQKYVIIQGDHVCA